MVREVIDRFAAGESLRGMAGGLTENGHTTRHGKPWHPSSVRTMLTNPRYAGHVCTTARASPRRRRGSRW